MILELPKVAPQRGSSPLVEAVTPELALVDPDLRRRLLDIALETRVFIGATGGSSAAISVRRPVPADAPDEKPPRRQKGLRQRAWVVAMGVSVIGLAAYAVVASMPFAVHSTGRGEAAALSSATTIPLAPPSGLGPRPPDSSADPHAVRYVWAPAVGATSYEVGVYRGATRVLSASTRQTSIEILEGAGTPARRDVLGPGTYRWYVWPVRQGIREATAVVQAKLLVTSG